MRQARLTHSSSHTGRLSDIGYRIPSFYFPFVPCRSECRCLDRKPCKLVVDIVPVLCERVLQSALYSSMTTSTRNEDCQDQEPRIIGPIMDGSPDSLSAPLLPNNGGNGDNTQEEEVEVGFVDGLPWDRSILIKSLYFLDALGSSTWGRFGAIYYNLHGINSQHIGIIEGLNTSIPTLSMPLWGILADRFHSRKRIWLLTKAFSTVILLLLAVPAVYSSFVNILIVSIAAQLFVSDGILDSYTLDLLGTENKIFYGRYRLYASLSWGIGSMIMGYVTDHYGFEPNFIMFGLLGFCMLLLVGTKIPETTPPPPPPPEEDGGDGDAQPAGQISELLLLAIRPQVFIFLVEVVIMGAAMATVERLLFLYLINDLEASTLLCGLSVGVNVLFELPIFWYASKFMAVFGHDGMFILSMSCFSVRVIGYTLLTPATKWLVLLLEIMHGVTFACFWVVSTDISKVLVHQTRGAFWSTAIPSGVQMLYSSVGVSLGSVLGGWAMHRYGSREMYTVTAGIVLCTLFVQLIGSITTRILYPGSSFLPDYPHLEEEDVPNEGDHGAAEPESTALLVDEGHVA
jgi:PPP family 3-phenylpropionic acid transporter